MTKNELQYPYQDTRLADLKDEKWEPVPGFDGYYEVSSFGRIKSLERIITGRWGTDTVIQPRIRRSRLSKTLNKTTGTYIYSLVTTLNKDGIKYYFSVSRLVYICFVKPIDLEDLTKLISYRDGDGRNTHFGNLYEITTSEMLLTAYRNNRHKSHLSVLSKKVTQYNNSGEPIAWYRSFYEAAKSTGLLASNIAAVANGNGFIYKGFFWRTGHKHAKLSLKKISNEDAPDNGINRPLQKRLGIVHSSENEIPACINLSLKNMAGERWEPFPGYDGLYEISSLGRVKSLRRTSGSKQIKWVSEKIKKLTFVKPKEKGIATSGTGVVSLDKGDEKHTYTVSRYVYYCFVETFNLNDKTLRVYNKDGNSSNLHFKNLVLKNAVWSINKPKSKQDDSTM